MCIFCRIAKGEIPAYKVYEDQNTLAFLDANPVSPGHTLVITKKHYQNIEEIPDQDLQELIVTVKKVAYLLKTKLGAESYNIEVNNDKVSGQLIPHLHFHLIPRHADDGYQSYVSIGRHKYAPGEAEEIIKKINA